MIILAEHVFLLAGEGLLACGSVVAIDIMDTVACSNVVPRNNIQGCSI